MSVKGYGKKLKKITKKLTNKYFWAESQYLTYYRKLPIVQKSVLLEAHFGIRVDGNLYYIAKELLNNPQYAEYKVYMTVRANIVENAKSKLQHIDQDHKLHFVEFQSTEYFKLLASVQFIAVDTSMHGCYIKKPGQTLLNTWHGTPLKYLGKKSHSEYDVLGNIQRSFTMADYLLYPNAFTRDHMVEDYMLENISSAKTVLGGYPRNTPFFDEDLQRKIRKELDLTGRKVYAFMPTFRGTSAKVGTARNDTYLNYYLYELDDMLSDDEVLYINLHPMTKKSVSIKEFRHLKPFPTEYETYEFLSIADCLITDYSSVFFDFANTGRKIVLFTYDLEEYIQDRGMYLNIRDLPFPKVRTVDQLVEQLRTPKNYDDTDFLKTYCAYDSARATEKLCNLVFWGKRSDLTIKSVADNGKENVILYCGNLAGNGITTSLQSLIHSLDLSKRNYYLAYQSEKIRGNQKNLLPFLKKVNYIAVHGDMNVTISARIVRKLFKWKWLPAPLYIKLNRKYLRYELMRICGNMRIDTAVQFTGYEDEVTTLWSQFDCKKVIYVHNDMEREIAVRHNQRKDLLRYAYSHYDRVAIVTEDLRESTSRIAGGRANLFVVRNLIDYKTVQHRSREGIKNLSIQLCTHDSDELAELLNSGAPKFITIGRFSPEKNHALLIEAFKKLLENDAPDAKLIIMGGNQYQGYYGKTKELVEKLGLSKQVVMIMNTPNPYPILNKCDYFVLSSQYEGFGLVLAEADILGKPVISTDITGPRLFMQEHGGTLVENSIDGVYQGMRRMLAGEIKPMNVDYEKYNQVAIQEFEQLLQ